MTTAAEHLKKNTLVTSQETLLQFIQVHEEKKKEKLH